MTAPTVAAEDSGSTIFGVSVSDLQSNVTVGNGYINGTLKYIDSGVLADDWGAGYFMALKFSDIDENATSIKVGLDPSQGSGLVEILGDPDMNGVFKVTDKTAQDFKVVITDGTYFKTKTYDLAGLVLESQEAAQG